MGEPPGRVGPSGAGPLACAPAGPLTYAAAGVDIGAGEEAVRRIGPRVRSTFGPEVLADLGGFAGLYALPEGRWDRPVLVATTDGVGTKAAVARLAGRYGTIGVDLVAMCVDDLVCAGAEPLFLLDYYATSRLDPAVAEIVVGGVADGCRQAGCALVGGEMAEHPGGDPDAFDLAGFAVGVVERDRVLGPALVRPGDVLVGLLSPGLRCNGYSLARRVLLEDARLPLDGPAWPGAEVTLADELLRPSVIYAPAVVALARELSVRAVAHVTGGGIGANLARVLPPGCDAELSRSTWPTPPIFGEIGRLGQVDGEEMARVFNLGLGMVAVMGPEGATAAVDLLAGHGHEAAVVGRVVAGRGRVRLDP
ncbi:MAG: phosphoribosylformylglycinamidine cyclo-ligase [Acidimicrobiales bacterium]